METMNMTTTIQVRTEAELKRRSEKVLNELGMDLSGAIRVFLNQVVLRGGLPFEVALPQPNAATLKAISDSYNRKNIGRASSVASMLDEFEKSAD
jgi:DNA-damage-inducible protein J